MKPAEKAGETGPEDNVKRGRHCNKFRNGYKETRKFVISDVEMHVSTERKHEAVEKVGTQSVGGS